MKPGDVMRATIEGIGTIEMSTATAVTPIAFAPTKIRTRRLGHLVLLVRDLKKSVAFYTEVLGLEVSGRRLRWYKGKVMRRNTPEGYAD